MCVCVCVCVLVFIGCVVVYTVFCSLKGEVVSKLVVYFSITNAYCNCVTWSFHPLNLRDEQVFCP